MNNAHMFDASITSASHTFSNINANSIAPQLTRTNSDVPVFSLRRRSLRFSAAKSPKNQRATKNKNYASHTRGNYV